MQENLFAHLLQFLVQDSIRICIGEPQKPVRHKLRKLRGAQIYKARMCQEARAIGTTDIPDS